MPLRVTRGDTEVMVVNVKNADGSARNIAQDALSFSATNTRLQDTPLTRSDGDFVRTGTVGEARVTFAPSAFNALEAGQTLNYAIRLEEPDGDVYTIARDKLEIR